MHIKFRNHQKANEEIDLKVNSENTKYMITSCRQNVLQNQNIRGARAPKSQD